MATKTATKKPLTEQQKQQALANARARLEYRRAVYAKAVRRNSFSQWGNEKCISRTLDTIRDMERGVASDSQYRYWLNH